MTATDNDAQAAISINVTADGVDLTMPIGRRGRWDHEADERIYEEVTLGDAVAEYLANALMKEPAYNRYRDEVLTARQELIRERLTPIVEDAINGPIPRTNNYGEVTGQTTTLRELIVKEVSDYLRRPADQYHRDRGTLVEKFVADAVDKAIKTQLAEVVLAEKQKVVAAVRAKAAELIAQAVKEGIGR